MIDINKATRSELELYIRSKGKRANQRIVELSRSKYRNASKALSYIERQAFDNSKYYGVSASGNVKFTVSTRELTKGLNKQQAMASLRAQAQEIQKFLSAKSSTVTGIKKQFESASKTLSEKYEANISAEELGEMFKVYDERNLKFGSDQVIDTYKKYMNELSIEDMKRVIEDTTGVTVNDVDMDFKRRILVKRYYNEIPVAIIEEVIRDNRTATVNELAEILEEYLDNEEFYDNWD